MDRIVATAGTAKTYGHGYVRLESQIAALTADAAFEGGHYRAPPERGLQAFSLVWTGWLFTQAWWRQELWRNEFPPPATLADVIAHYRTQFIPGADANDLILQCRTWQQHDVAGEPRFAGELAAALGSIQAQVLYMPAESDLYFPIDEARADAALIPHCHLAPIRSLWGHPAGAGASPADAAFINAHVAAFLAGDPLPELSPD
jgi:homoserine O-acetyltransferase